MSQEGSIDPGEGTSGLETDAGAVNRAILSGIQRLNESIASLGGYHGAHDEFEDDLESEDVSYVSIQNDLHNIASVGPGTKPLETVRRHQKHTERPNQSHWHRSEKQGNMVHV